MVIQDNSIFLAYSSSSGFGGILLSIDGGETYPNIMNDGLLYNDADQLKTDKVGRILMHQYAKKLYRSTDTVMTKMVNLNRPPSNKVSIFPNPCFTYATIKSESDKAIHLEMLNETGSKIISIKLEPFGSYLLDTSQITSGVYILRSHCKYYHSQCKLIRR